MKKQYKYYQIAVIFFCMTLLAALLQAIFVVAPIYDLAAMNSADAAERLQNLRLKGRVSGTFIALSLFLFALFLIIGWVTSLRQKYGKKL